MKKKTFSFLTADGIINSYEAGNSIESIHKKLITLERYKDYTIKDIKRFLNI